MSETTLFVIVAGLIAAGVFLPRAGRLTVTALGLLALIAAALFYWRDGPWTFIHNDNGMFLLGAIGACLFVGALLGEAIAFAAKKLGIGRSV